MKGYKSEPFLYYVNTNSYPISFKTTEKSRDVEIFLDMPVIWTDFENLVSPNNNMQQKY